jgi:superfamily II DNA/RNA helicase
VRAGLRNPVRVAVRVESKHAAAAAAAAHSSARPASFQAIPASLTVRYAIVPADRKLAALVGFLERCGPAKVFFFLRWLTFFLRDLFCSYTTLFCRFHSTFYLIIACFSHVILCSFSRALLFHTTTGDCLLSHVHFCSTRPQVIVYFLTCACVDYFSRVVRPFLPSITIMSLHGKVPAAARTATFEKFSSLESGALFCTDVAGE